MANSAHPVLETRTALIHLEGDVVVNRIKPLAVETLADSLENVAGIGKVASETPTLLLVDMGDVRGVSIEARRTYASVESAKTIRAAALLVQTQVSKVIGSFFLGLNRPPFPARLFTDRGQALEWLRCLGSGLEDTEQP